METKVNIMVSQLTAYEKKRLNSNRKCELCGKEIRDFQTITFLKLRDRRKVFYKFCHHECYKLNNNSFEKEE